MTVPTTSTTVAQLKCWSCGRSTGRLVRHDEHLAVVRRVREHVLLAAGGRQLRNDDVVVLLIDPRRPAPTERANPVNDIPARRLGDLDGRMVGWRSHGDLLVVDDEDTDLEGWTCRACSAAVRLPDAPAVVAAIDEHNRRGGKPSPVTLARIR